MSKLGLLVRLSGRSWWQVRYYGGETVSEWETIPDLESQVPAILRAQGQRSRWEDIDKHRVSAIRLLCPNGQAGEISATRPNALFQFKIGAVRINALRQRSCEAQVIGGIDGDDGACTCYAWEMSERRLVQFTDNVHAMKYRQVGPLGVSNLELK